MHYAIFHEVDQKSQFKAVMQYKLTELNIYVYYF